MGGSGSAVLVLGLLFVGALAKPKVGINYQTTLYPLILRSLLLLLLNNADHLSWMVPKITKLHPLPFCLSRL